MSNPVLLIVPVVIVASTNNTSAAARLAIPADGGRVDQLGVAGLFVGTDVMDRVRGHCYRDEQVEHSCLPDVFRSKAVVVDLPVAGCAGWGWP